MIKIEQYENPTQALEGIIKLDEDYTIIRHNFSRGEIVDPHKHNVDEWVVFSSGKCEVGLGLESQILEAKNVTLAIYFPKEQEHKLTCLTDISYWVLRTTK